RDVKFSDPAINARLGVKVMRLLETRTLVDPATEILQLEAEVEKLKQQIAGREKSMQTLGVERDALLGALASAVPQLKDGGDRLAVGMARISCLKPEADQAPARTAGSGPAKNKVP